MLKKNTLLLVFGMVILLGLLALLILLALLVVSSSNIQIASLFASATPVPTSTQTATPSPSATASSTATSTETETATATATNTRAPSPTPTTTSTATITPAVSRTPTPSATSASTSTATPSTLVETGPNLLVNASFEEGSSVYNNDGDQRVPNGWLPWWSSPVINNCYNAKPHYEIENHSSHVRDGNASARYYTGYQSHNAGLMQQVAVTRGLTYQFSIYGFAWSTDNPVVDTPSTSTTKLWIGIDPAGGTDPTASTVVWSPENVQMDTFGYFSVQARAASSTITVFTRSRPDWCVARNDSFWDAASLVQMAAP